MHLSFSLHPIGKKLYIMKRIALFFMLAVLLSASQLPTPKNFTVTGIVTDSNQEALIGASINIKGTAQGTLTDFDGKFSLAIPQTCATLVFSYTGFDNQEIKVCEGKDTHLKVVLNESAIHLDEVVVTGFGVKIRKNKDRKKARDQRPAPAMSAPAQRQMNAVMPSSPVQDHYIDFNTEDYDHITENRFYQVTQTPLSTFSIDVDAASYSNMRRYLNNGVKPPIDAIRIEEMVNYFNYEYPNPTGEHPFEVITEVSECPWQPGHKLLHIGLQGKKIPTENLPASNLVFLIDASGSMNAPNKMPLLQSSFKLLADQLRPNDKVAIVVYAGAAGLVLPSTKGDNTQKIKEAIDQLRAGGSTAGGAGVQLAYKVARENFVEGGNNRVILATDGDFNVGASSDSELVRMIEKERESGVFLTVMGFGMGNYKDNKMQKLANSGNGNHAYIDNISEAQKVLVNEFGGTMFTIAKDVKLQIEFNPAQVAGYRLIGYENRMLEKEDFNDDQKDAGELGAGHTVTAMYEIIPAGTSSKYLTSVDELKYQNTDTKGSKKYSEELMTLKLRYKKPDGLKSQLIEHAVMDQNVELKEASQNFLWAAAVAEFGMLLRESEYKGDATYAHAIRLAKSSKGPDLNGYRQEMINMLQTMKSLADPDVAGK